MSFDNLWEKYGDKTEPEKVPKRNPVKKEGTVQTEKTVPSNKKTETAPTKKDEKNDGLMPGVFGGEASDISGGGREEKIHGRFDFGAVRDWPWVDIIFITLTGIMIIWVIINFESVTTALFYAMLPLLCDIFALLVTVGLIVLGIWWFTRRR